MGGGAYAQDKNTSVRVCAKNAGGAYARGGAYLRDTTVIFFVGSETLHSGSNIQWNATITDTIGNQHFGRYREVSQLRGFRYTSGRRGMCNQAVEQWLSTTWLHFRAFLCCMLAGKASTTNNSANLTTSS